MVKPSAHKPAVRNDWRSYKRGLIASFLYLMTKCAAVKHRFASRPKPGCVLARSPALSAQKNFCFKTPFRNHRLSQSRHLPEYKIIQILLLEDSLFTPGIIRILGRQTSQESANGCRTGMRNQQGRV